ncbi:MAG TPA: hypothetical protein PLJ74_05285 [Myxococcota bacterium]|nr:hypothetical protein [Myxococcota bacterium]
MTKEELLKTYGLEYRGNRDVYRTGVMALITITKAEVEQQASPEMLNDLIQQRIYVALHSLGNELKEVQAFDPFAKNGAMEHDSEESD